MAATANGVRSTINPVADVEGTAGDEAHMAYLRGCRDVEALLEPGRSASQPGHVVGQHGVT